MGLGKPIPHHNSSFNVNHRPRGQRVYESSPRYYHPRPPSPILKRSIRTPPPRPPRQPSQEDHIPIDVRVPRTQQAIEIAKYFESLSSESPFVLPPMPVQPTGTVSTERSRFRKIRTTASSSRPVISPPISTGRTANHNARGEGDRTHGKILGAVPSWLEDAPRLTRATYYESLKGRRSNSNAKAGELVEYVPSTAQPVCSSNYTTIDLERFMISTWNVSRSGLYPSPSTSPELRPTSEARRKAGVGVDANWIRVGEEEEEKEEEEEEAIPKVKPRLRPNLHMFGFTDMPVSPEPSVSSLPGSSTRDNRPSSSNLAPPESGSIKIGVLKSKSTWSGSTHSGLKWMSLPKPRIITKSNLNKFDSAKLWGWKSGPTSSPSGPSPNSGPARPTIAPSVDPSWKPQGVRVPAFAPRLPDDTSDHELLRHQMNIGIPTFMVMERVVDPTSKSLPYLTSSSGAHDQSHQSNSPSTNTPKDPHIRRGTEKEAVWPWVAGKPAFPNLDDSSTCNQRTNSTRSEPAHSSTPRERKPDSRSPSVPSSSWSRLGRSLNRRLPPLPGGPASAPLECTPPSAGLSSMAGRLPCSPLTDRPDTYPPSISGSRATTTPESKSKGLFPPTPAPIPGASATFSTSNSKGLFPPTRPTILDTPVFNSKGLFPPTRPSLSHSPAFSPTPNSKGLFPPTRPSTINPSLSPVPNAKLNNQLFKKDHRRAGKVLDVPFRGNFRKETIMEGPMRIEDPPMAIKFRAHPTQGATPKASHLTTPRADLSLSTPVIRIPRIPRISGKDSAPSSNLDAQRSIVIPKPAIPLPSSSVPKVITPRSIPDSSKVIVTTSIPRTRGTETIASVLANPRVPKIQRAESTSTTSNTPNTPKGDLPPPPITAGPSRGETFSSALRSLRIDTIVSSSSSLSDSRIPGVSTVARESNTSSIISTPGIANTPKSNAPPSTPSVPRIEISSSTLGGRIIPKVAAITRGNNTSSTSSTPLRILRSTSISNTSNPPNILPRVNIMTSSTNGQGTGISPPANTPSRSVNIGRIDIPPSSSNIPGSPNIRNAASIPSASNLPRNTSIARTNIMTSTAVDHPMLDTSLATTGASRISNISGGDTPPVSPTDVRVPVTRRAGSMPTTQSHSRIPSKTGAENLSPIIGGPGISSTLKSDTPPLTPTGPTMTRISKSYVSTPASGSVRVATISGVSGSSYIPHTPTTTRLKLQPISLNVLKGPASPEEGVSPLSTSLPRVPRTYRMSSFIRTAPRFPRLPIIRAEVASPPPKPPRGSKRFKAEESSCNPSPSRVPRVPRTDTTTTPDTSRNPNNPGVEGTSSSSNAPVTTGIPRTVTLVTPVAVRIPSIASMERIASNTQALRILNMCVTSTESVSSYSPTASTDPEVPEVPESNRGASASTHNHNAPNISAISTATDGRESKSSQGHNSPRSSSASRQGMFISNSDALKSAGIPRPDSPTLISSSPVNIQSLPWPYSSTLVTTPVDREMISMPDAPTGIPSLTRFQSIPRTDTSVADHTRAIGFQNPPSVDTPARAPRATRHQNTQVENVTSVIISGIRFQTNSRTDTRIIPTPNPSRRVPPIPRTDDDPSRSYTTFQFC